MVKAHISAGLVNVVFYSLTHLKQVLQRLAGKLSKLCKLFPHPGHTQVLCENTIKLRLE